MHMHVHVDVIDCAKQVCMYMCAHACTCLFTFFSDSTSASDVRRPDSSGQSFAKEV